MTHPTSELVECPLCGSSASFWCRASDHHYGLSGEWEVFECGSCLHRFQWPIPTEEQLAEAYPDSYYAFQRPTTNFEPRGIRRRGVWLRLHHFKRDRGYEDLSVRGNLVLALGGRVLRRFPLEFGAPVFRPGGVLLDYGSGTGESVAFARYTGWQAEGIDMSPAAASVGREAGLAIDQGTVGVLEARPRRYDHIMSSHCVEHVPDVRRLFAAFFSALKPGGTLAIDVPNGRSQAADHFKDLYYHLTMPLHVHLFSPASLRSLAEDAGFTDIRLGSYSRLRWQAESQLLRTAGGSSPQETTFHTTPGLSRTKASVAAMPQFLRSLRRLRGDCLVLTAIKE